MSEPTTITLEDGRIFPVLEGAILSWDPVLYCTLNEERAGYPKMRAVIRAMREHRPDYLEKDRKQMQRDQLDRMFGHNAKKVLAVIEAECEFPVTSSMGPTEGEL